MCQFGIITDRHGKCKRFFIKISKIKRERRSLSRQETSLPLLQYDYFSSSDISRT